MQSKTKLTDYINYQELGTLIAIILFGAFVQYRNNTFLTASNINDILRSASILAIMAMGMMMILITRGIDLSIGAVIGLVGMCVARIMIPHPEISPLMAIAMGLVFGMACGCVNGILVAYGKVPPIIATMGTMNVYRGLCYMISGGEWVSAYEMTDGFKQIALGNFAGVNNLIVIAVIIFIIGTLFLKHTRTGRKIYAVGSNPDAAAISGINNSRVLLMTYGINGMLAGLCGILWVSKYASAQGNSGMGYEMNVIAACVLGGVSVSGGTGRPLGLLLGVTFFAILYNSLSMIYISAYAEDAIEAGIILVAILINVIIRRRRQLTEERRREI